MLVVTGSVTAREESFDRIRAQALAHVHRSREEPGCISHEVAVDCENPLRLVFLERWESREALAVHFRVPESGAFVGMLRDQATATTGPDIYEIAPPPGA